MISRYLDPWGKVGRPHGLPKPEFGLEFGIPAFPVYGLWLRVSGNFRFRASRSQVPITF